MPEPSEPLEAAGSDPPTASDSPVQPPTPVAPFDWPTVAPAGERSATTYDAFRRTTDVMRDTTKWVVSFVPGAGLIVTLAAVVPGVADLDSHHRWGPIVLLVIAGVLVTIALVFAARVLAAKPPGWRWVIDTYAAEKADGAQPGPRSLSTELDSEGFLHLYAYDSAEQFFGAIATPDMTNVKTSLGPGATVMDFAALREMRGRFALFATVGVLAAIGAVACVVGAQLQVASTPKPPSSLNPPLSGEVVPTPAGITKLAAGAACRDLTLASRVKVWVVAGNFTNASIIVDDPACTPSRIQWTGAADGVIVPIPGGTGRRPAGFQRRPGASLREQPARRSDQIGSRGPSNNTAD